MALRADERRDKMCIRDRYMFFPEGEYKNHPEKSEDNTHLRYDGAVNFASLIAKGLKEIGGIYAEMLLDDLKL